MSQTFTLARLPLNFYEFPPRVVISVEPELKLFLYQTGLQINSQEHHEITRQIFDNIDFGFDQYCSLLNQLPLFKLLSSFALDQMKYVDLNGNFNSLSMNLKQATKTYGLAIYMTCKKVGIFDGEKTPYILETIQNDLLVLHNGFTNQNQ